MTRAKRRKPKQPKQVEILIPAAQAPAAEPHVTRAFYERKVEIYSAVRNGLGEAIAVLEREAGVAFAKRDDAGASGLRAGADLLRRHLSQLELRHAERLAFWMKSVVAVNGDRVEPVHELTVAVAD